MEYAVKKIISRRCYKLAYNFWFSVGKLLYLCAFDGYLRIFSTCKPTSSKPNWPIFCTTELQQLCSGAGLCILALRCVFQTYLSDFL
jgi:hypothetical protein